MHEESRLVLEELPEAAPGQRSVLGFRLRSHWNAFVAQQLEHLAFEEEQLSPRALARLHRRRVGSLMARIHGTIPAERMLIWRTLLLPAIDRRERARLQAAAQPRRDAA